MKKIDHQKLRALTTKLLQAGGSTAAEATSVADHLVDANLAGHDSHGVGMLPHYVRNLKAGSLVPNRKHEVVSETGSFAVWDGHGGYGQVIAREAMEWAIGAARQHGVAVHALRNTHHIGRVGAYGELAAAAGLTSLHFVNGNSGKPLVAPYRGREGRFSTNPVCIAIPGTATTKPTHPRHGDEPHRPRQGPRRPQRGQARRRGRTDRPGRQDHDRSRRHPWPERRRDRCRAAVRRAQGLRPRPRLRDPRRRGRGIGHDPAQESRATAASSTAC